MRTLAAIAVLSLALSSLATGAGAEVLRVQCRLHEMRGSAHRDLMRHIQIDLGARTAKFWDNVGHGWQLKGAHPIVSADAARIVLDAADGKASYIDRRTGQYLFHNDHDGVTLRGGCEKVATGAGDPL